MTDMVPFNPIDSNPAVAACAVCPQSGRIATRKNSSFSIFLHIFSK